MGWAVRRGVLPVGWRSPLLALVLQAVPSQLGRSRPCLATPHLPTPQTCYPLTPPHSCRARITKLERIPAGAGLFISPLTLQGYRSEADLARHAQQVEGQLEALAAGALGAAQQQQQQQQWKPAPPPGAPPGGGRGRPQQFQQRARQGWGR